MVLPEKQLAFFVPFARVVSATSLSNAAEALGEPTTSKELQVIINSGGRQRDNLDRGGGQVSSPLRKQVYACCRSSESRIRESLGGFPRPTPEGEVPVIWPLEALLDLHTRFTF